MLQGAGACGKAAKPLRSSLRSTTSPLCEEAFTRAKPAQKGSPQGGELAAAHPTVKVGKVNTDENLQLAMARKIDAIPALLLFKNGQEVSRSVGYRPAAELEAWLRENGAI